MSSEEQKSILGNLSISNKKSENSWVVLMKEELFNNSGFKMIILPHPSNGQPSKYCLDPCNKCVYEFVTFNEPNRSWFFGNSVKSDGRLHMCTPINPIFIVLPRLKSQCNNKAVPLKDLLSEKGFIEIIDYIKTLNDVADSKGPEVLKAYKYNEEKTLNWLKTKVENLAKVVKRKNIHVSNSAISATFIPSTLDHNDIDEELYLKYAFGIVSEYLEDDLMTKLEKLFKFKPDLVEHLSKKRKSDTENCNNNKKIKNEDDTCAISSFINIPTEIKKPKVLTVKEKARQKAAAGTKTISAFFTKKS